MQWSAETNALITVLGFKWLVGPLETKEVEVEFEGEKQKWKSGVQIKKCRYLEQSGCIGKTEQLLSHARWCLSSLHLGGDIPSSHAHAEMPMLRYLLLSMQECVSTCVRWVC